MTTTTIQTAFAQVRQAEHPAFGWVVSILGVDYTQADTKAAASKMASTIEAHCAAMTAGEVRAYYKLGDE